ncbi:MAG: hypothetical protein ACOYOU_10745 [Kiritimatiellia bacterium]
MDYQIRADSKELDPTGYMEIGPGRYNKKHWQPGFLFIWEDAFGMAEGIVTKHFPSYDHFGMNDISKKIASASWECRNSTPALVLITREDAASRTDAAR